MTHSLTNQFLSKMTYGLYVPIRYKILWQFVTIKWAALHQSVFTYLVVRDAPSRDGPRPLLTIDHIFPQLSEEHKPLYCVQIWSCCRLCGHYFSNHDSKYDNLKSLDLNVNIIGKYHSRGWTQWTEYLHKAVTDSQIYNILVNKARYVAGVFMSKCTGML